jgi:CheY-like chemotaxis protein
LLNSWLSVFELRRRRFLDLQLPDMHGIHLIEKIRALPALVDTPIVVVSGEDKIDLAEVKHKPLVLIKQNGILPGETVRLIQSTLDNPPAAYSG